MVAIAVPSSLVSKGSNSSIQQATFSLYQIARACTLLGADEIIVYNAHESPEQTEPVAPEPTSRKIKLDETDSTESRSPVNTDRNPDLIFAANMLQYFITPGHLRKLLFKPMGNQGQFKYAKSLPRLPGVMELKNIAQGIAVPKKRKRRLPGQNKLSKRDRKDATLTPFVNVGFDKLLKLQEGTSVPVNSRVFVDIKSRQVVDEKKLSSEEKGTFGYSVRAVTSFSSIFTQSPLKDGYSQTIYIPSQQFKSHRPNHPLIQQVSLAQCQNKETVLLVFGTWDEVQSAIKQDPELDLDDASALFDGVSLGMQQARVEDAVMISLARFNQ